jgi:hypothetical protein
MKFKKRVSREVREAETGRVCGTKLALTLKNSRIQDYLCVREKLNFN